MAETAAMDRSLLRRSRLTFLFLILITGVVGGVAAYWFGELEPHLGQEAHANARTLATAMAGTLSASMVMAGADITEPVGRALDHMLLLTSPGTGEPFIVQVAIDWDGDATGLPEERLRQVRGETCDHCFAAEAPLFHPRTRELSGIAHFLVSDTFHTRLRAQLQRRILVMAAMGFVLIALVWRAVAALSAKLGQTARELSIANEGLEKKVRERTRALQEAHERLLDETRKRRQLEQARNRLRKELEEEERARLAAMLHDGPGQTVQALLLGLKMLRNGPLPSPGTATPLESLIRDTTQAIGEIRGITRDLRPLTLEGITLAEAVQRQCERMARLSGLTVSVRIQDDLPGLDQEEMGHIYLMFQEMLNNSVKHALARRITVTLGEPEPDLLRLKVADDGRGFDPDRVTPGREAGYGLSILRERILGMGGKLAIDSVPGQGTTIQLEVSTHDSNSAGR